MRQKRWQPLVGILICLDILIDLKEKNLKKLRKYFFFTTNFSKKNVKFA